MTIELSSIAGRKDLTRERLILKVTSDDDIGFYAIFRSAVFDEPKVSSGPIPFVYWFTNKSVKAGDYVVLYTKGGTRSEKKSENEQTSHFFYWGLEKPIWTDGYMPVLVETPNWSILEAPEEKKSRSGT